MALFTNLRTWDKEKKDFILQDIEVKDPEELLEKNIKEIDCSSFMSIPNAMDIHVHFREPGYEYKENMLSGALAAIYGGVTKVLDMPNTRPITNSVDRILHKKALAKKQKWIDILIASAITNDNIQEIEQIDKYCDAYKVFMAESFGKLVVDEDKIVTSLTILESIESSKPIFFHAESPLVIEQCKNEKGHQKQRPPEAEAEAIQKISTWAQEYNNLKFHITHLSSSLSLKLLEVVKTDNLTIDTCPRYLYFDENTDLPEYVKKVNPPLRSTIDRIQLTQALATGFIDMISSDHSPHSLQEKEEKNLSGLPGVQEMLPSLINLITLNELGWERAIEAFHNFPYKLFDIEESDKADSDFIIIDISKPYELNELNIQTKSKWSPYSNLSLMGDILYVVKDGNLVLIK
ncbi:MAG: dihydroorotase family protein [Candidatus Thorarchaeota archaeon]